jgi:hypothetical protein
MIPITKREKIKNKKFPTKEMENTREIFPTVSRYIFFFSFQK